MPTKFKNIRTVFNALQVTINKGTVVSVLRTARNERMVVNALRVNMTGRTVVNVLRTIRKKRTVVNALQVSMNESTVVNVLRKSEINARWGLLSKSPSINARW